MRIIGRLSLIVAITYCFLSLMNIHNIRAEEKTLQIWDYTDNVNERIEHRSIEIGGENKRFDVMLTSNTIIVDKYNWSSSNSDIASIEKETTNNPIIHGLKEGSAKISLEIKTKDGEKYSDETIVSVYTPIDNVHGKLKENATLYRGADNKSWVRTENEKKQPNLSVIGSCGNYYYVEMPKDYVFGDKRDKRKAYVEKSKVDIPATGIKLDTNKLSLKQGGTYQFKASIIPDIATDVTEKDIVWKVNSEKASIKNNGYLNAWRKGKVTVKVGLKGKTFVDECELTITAQIAENYISPFDLILRKKANKKEKITAQLERSVGANEHYIECYKNNKWVKIYEAYGEDFNETELIDLFNFKLGQEFKLKGVARLVRVYQDKENDYKVLKTIESKVITIKLGDKPPKLTTVAAKKDYNQVKWKEPKGCKKYRKYHGKKVKYGLYRKTGKDKNYKHIKTTTKQEWMDKDVKKGQVYYYRVKRKYTKNNCSDYSKSKKVSRPSKKKTKNKKK